MTAKQSQDVINGRPYNTAHDLVAKGIISQQEFDRIADRLTAK